MATGPAFGEFSEANSYRPIFTIDSCFSLISSSNQDRGQPETREASPDAGLEDSSTLSRCHQTANSESLGEKLAPRV